MKKGFVRKFFAAAMCLTFLGAVPMGVSAAETVSEEDSVILVSGTATWLENGNLLLTPEKESEEQSIILNLTEDTVLLNEETGTPITANSLENGQVLYAYASAVMTRSNPPISNALFVMENVTEKVPSYEELREEWNQDALVGTYVSGSLSIQDGRCFLSSSSPTGDMYLTISEETKILDAVSGAAVDQSVLGKTQTVYAYIGPAMALSYPPIASAELVLCNIPADYRVPEYCEVSAVYPQKDGSTVVKTSDGKALTFDKEFKAEASTGEAAAITTLNPGDHLLLWKDQDGKISRAMIFADGANASGLMGIRQGDSNIFQLVERP